MTEIYVIAQPCIGTKDTACVPACPVDCIYQYDPAQKKLFANGSNPKNPNPTWTEEQLTSQLFIKPDECISCGACVAPCPVQAIFPIDELPEKWKHFEALNKDVFAQ